MDKNNYSVTITINNKDGSESDTPEQRFLDFQDLTVALMWVLLQSNTTSIVATIVKIPKK